MVLACTANSETLPIAIHVSLGYVDYRHASSMGTQTDSEPLRITLEKGVRPFILSIEAIIGWGTLLHPMRTHLQWRR